MKVNEELLNAATSIVTQNQEKMDSAQSIIDCAGCFGCGLGCSGTVG